MLAFICACCTGSLYVGWCKSRGKERPVLSRLVWTLLSCCSLVSCCLLTWSLSSLVWTLPPVPCSRLFCDWSLHCSTTCLLWHVQLHWEEPLSQRLSMHKALLAMNMIRHTYGHTLPALSRHFGAETKNTSIVGKRNEDVLVIVSCIDWCCSPQTKNCTGVHYMTYGTPAI